MDLICKPSSSLNGTIPVSGDKSLSHRAAILASIAHGEGKITGFLQSDDTKHTLAALKALGVTIESHQNTVKVQGRGAKSLIAPSMPLDFGNSGTGLRLVAGLLAGLNIRATLTGDSSLQKRPMARIVKPLTAMGANISGRNQGLETLLPLQLYQTDNLKSIDYQLPIPSAQIKSCLLFASLAANIPITIKENLNSRDHTELLFKHYGIPIKLTANSIHLPSCGPVVAKDVIIPGDISSAAFFIVAAAIVPGSHIKITNVGVNPTRMGLIKILRLMGANIVINMHPSSALYSEPVADIEVSYTKLSGISVPKQLIPSTIDEFPILFIAAACATGRTVFTHLQELKHKESNRLEAMAKGLAKLGGKFQLSQNGIVIYGSRLQGGEIDCLGDHRIAMAFAIAAMVAESNITIKNCQNIATSFPDFCIQANKLGCDISQIKDEKLYKELNNA